MAEKKNSSEDEDRNDSDEIIERLDPRTKDEKEVDIMFVDDEEIDDDSLDRLFIDDEKAVDPSIDRLFDEDRKSFQKGLKDEVQKALSLPEMSKASLFRMRTNEPSETALTGEIARQKTVEEIWEAPTDASNAVVNRKSIIAICVSIALLAIAGGWALWKSTNSERGNDDVLIAQENAAKERQAEKLLLNEEISDVSEAIDHYLTATTVSQKSEWIYSAKTSQEDIIAYYRSNKGVEPAKDFNIENIFPINIDGEEVWEVFIKNENHKSEGLRSYYVRKDTDGDYKVDWKADVVFQESDIKKFIETRSKVATGFKFVVEPLYKMTTYNWGFNDLEYKVVRLAIPNSDFVFWGYVKKGSPEQEKLNRYIESDLRNSVLDTAIRHEFILKVRFLEGSPRENDQYILIDDIVSRKWINTDE